MVAAAIFFIVFYSGIGTPTTLRFVLLYTVIFTGPVQETVREAGFELGTVA
jgi:hypothetical protein